MIKAILLVTALVITSHCNPLNDSNTTNESPIYQKTSNFFGGFIIDVKKFFYDNKIIDSNASK